MAGSHRGGLPHGVQYLLSRGHGAAAFLGHYLAIHPNRKFPVVSVHKLNCNSGFLPEFCRQTGGVLAERASNGTLTYLYLFHCDCSFQGTWAKLHRKRVANGAPSEVVMALLAAWIK